MSLIDADSLYDALGNKLTWLMGYGDDVYLAVGNDIRDAINSQPTAYDIDKVVEELEELAESHRQAGFDVEKNGFSNIANKMYGKQCAFMQAIEIVKQGGVTDDVCEWEKGSSGYVGYPAYYSKCCTTNLNGLEMQTHIITDWKYCPYCGKKIKIVGD